jgi:hypothetical protein
MLEQSQTNDTATETRSHAANAADRALWPARVLAVARRTTSPRFYVCVAILLVAAASMQFVAQLLGGYFRKDAVPLKRPLDLLNQDKLLPEYRTHRRQPPPLSPETVENLGTEQYLQWYLVDQNCGSEDPTAVVHLFITYHTGQPDLVPHNPKECYAAGGADYRDETTITVEVARPDGEVVKIPVSVLEFDPPGHARTLSPARAGGKPRLIVAYFFYTNGKYVTSRTGVRTATANLWDRYAYYSKIELSFTDSGLTERPDREAAIAATRRLLRKLMPILWEDHYQDWEALENGVPPVTPEH